METPMNNYCCDVYEHEYFIPAHTTKAAFFIDFFFTVDRDSPTIYRNLKLPQEQILQNSNSWSTISRKLSEMNVPMYMHARIMHKITDRARFVVNNQDHNMNCNVIPLVVNIKAVNDDEAATSEAVRRSINEQIVNLVPASWSSIEALEKTRVKGCSKPCVICLEEILVGSKAARLPCSHVYHQDCIVNWLERSNLCPLCRFQMA